MELEQICKQGINNTYAISNFKKEFRKAVDEPWKEEPPWKRYQQKLIEDLAVLEQEKERAIDLQQFEKLNGVDRLYSIRHPESKKNVRVIYVEELMMGITEKLARAKETDWISEGFSEAEVKTLIELAKISARIERCRIDMQMTQKEFADYMGVTQGMVSKWESREYNFTIKTLNEICQKIDLELSVSLEKPCVKSD